MMTVLLSVFFSVTLSAQSIAESQSVQCNNSTNGELTFVPATGRDVSEYTYVWLKNGVDIKQYSYTAKSLSAGTYTLQYTLDGVTNELKYTLVEPELLTVPPANVIVASNDNWGADINDCTGSIQITPVGGTAPYTYTIYDVTWRRTFTTSSISKIPSGDYEITVVDNHGCTFATTATVDDAKLSPTAVGKSVGDTTYTCYKTTVSQLSNPSTTDVYPVGVSFDGESSKAAYFYVETAAQMASCPEYNNDTVWIVQTSTDRQGNIVYDTIPYVKTVINNNNGIEKVVLFKSKLVSETTDKPYIITSDLTSKNTFVQVTDINGVEWTRLMTQPSTSLTQTGLLPGFHTILYWTGTGYGNRKGWDVVAPDNPVTINYTKVSNKCYDGNAAQIRVNAQGSWHDYDKTSRFTLSLSGGSGGGARTVVNVLEKSWTGLTSGVYTATATDKHGCSRTQSIEVTQPHYPISMLFGTSNESLDFTNFREDECPCNVAGAVDSVFSGGSANVELFEAALGDIKYQWSVVNPSDKTITYNIDGYKVSYGSGADSTKMYINGKEYEIPSSEIITGQSTNKKISGLTPGLYALRIVDANGCSARDSVVVARDVNTENIKNNSTKCLYNIVTPNGDGYNDVFDLTDVACGYKMKCNIFDRNGRNVGHVEKNDANDYNTTYSWNPLEDSYQPPVGQSSTYTAFIHLYNDAGTVADLAQSFSVVFYKE